MTEQYDDKLIQAAGALATDIAPTRDLWPDIGAAIATPTRRRWTPMLAQAAAVIMLVGASSAVTYTVMKSEPEPAGLTIATPEMVFEQASFGSRYSLGPGFQDARNSLVAELDVELEKLSPDDRGNIETNLQLIHQAIYDINEALDADPGNTQLQAQLLRAYRHELALLRRVGGLTRNVMNRNDI